MRELGARAVPPATAEARMSRAWGLSRLKPNADTKAYYRWVEFFRDLSCEDLLVYGAQGEVAQGAVMRGATGTDAAASGSRACR